MVVKVGRCITWLAAKLEKQEEDIRSMFTLQDADTWTLKESGNLSL